MSSPTNITSHNKQPDDSSRTQDAKKSWDFVGNMLAPLGVRDFRLLFTGQMISSLGDMFYAVALPWLMLSSGHTPQELGIVLAAYGVPRVATLLVGGLCDCTFWAGDILSYQFKPDAHCRRFWYTTT